MICENPGCHCQSEFGVYRDGKLVCSEHCKPGACDPADLCRCGHPGCGSAEDLASVFAYSQLNAVYA